ncbi:MAG: VWA domain-containing protein, partial [Actinobacteria bacterium]|nr:VWA domain-containing protein [Actinomycetota bacterium]
MDVVLAIDGTGSMRSSIAQAQRDGERLIAGLREVTSDLRVGVVVFRDYRNPGGEYELLQALTGDDASVQTALQQVRAVSNRDPGNGAAESYSLLFRKSYSDSAVGWRPGARKVLVVIGEAEPYGAGAAGLAGCRNQAPDPHGLRATDELARLRAKGIVLLMVRETSTET